MTTENTLQKTSRFRLPDPPERNADEVTAFDHLYQWGHTRNLAMHFGDLETTLIAADRWIVASPDSNRSLARRPDLLIAFDVSPQDYEASNGYVISEQGKPPDFVMEIASESTGSTDTGAKRTDYAALGITEYWRFDKTGEYHKTKLAGDILHEGTYQPIPMEEITPDIVQGHSPALNLIIRWDHGRIRWLDPETGLEISNLESEREGRLSEQQGRLAAEDRVRELEAELAHRNTQD